MKNFLYISYFFKKMERILMVATETWDICVYHAMEVHNVIIIANKFYYQWIFK